MSLWWGPARGRAPAGGGPIGALGALAMLAVAALPFLAGCGTATPLAAPDTPTVAHRVLPADARTQPLAPYVFGVGDEFDLRVPDAPQFDQTLKVRPDGKVSLALVGTLHALGRTPEDVEAELRERLQRLGGLPGSREYLLQPGDEIDIKFAWQPTLNEAVKLRPDGKIQLQMVGVVQAQGLSPEELQAQLKTRYARFLRTPEVAVIVRSVTTQNIRVATVNGPVTGRAGVGALQPVVIVRSYQLPQVFVGGEVGKPGVLAYRPGLTLLQALTEAGGPLATGDAQHIVVLRRSAPGGATDASGASAASASSGEGVVALRLDLPPDFARQPDRDVALQPFDVVVLPKSDIAMTGERLNQYLFNLLPPLKNSSFGFVYDLSNTGKLFR